ncbi:hypothetical protein LOTGIDRAFT_175884 [Lottia gigantea]|uniref:Uncharacterized protein n=1 Tax=Lottia gigantea TaxID=225164 RepID=V3ZVM1_LOTGI|nr:hypothetical protein LOTGIDRAFT_175884 [Lottia gigantea]ESO88387.1 hypothetical protein LOTGIDRAFT_175884 [Lottia gigantea]
MAARNRPSSSKNKDDAIIETASFSKDNSQTFADFKMEMHEMHKKSFEEIQLIIANSMDNLRQPESRRTDKRPICGRKRVISESDVNNDRSEGEIYENSDSDFLLTQKKYKIPKLDKKRAGRENLDIIQQINELLEQSNDERDHQDHEKDDDSENDFEKFLEQEYSVVDKVGNVLPAKVADIIKHMFNTKQADDRSKGIMEKYLRPGNTELYPQKINTEIWGHLKKETQFKDIDSSN